MERESGIKNYGPAKERESAVLADAEQFRQTMREFWHRKVDPQALEKELEAQKERHMKELLRRGSEMEALRLLMLEEKDDRPFFHSDNFLLASQNETKRELIAEAADKEGMFLQETLFGWSAEDEEREHQILKQLIGEAKQSSRLSQEHAMREYKPAYFAIDVAEAKVSKMRETFKNRIIAGADIIVLQGDQILEKPKNREEALEMLQKISGKEIKVSLGVVLLIPTKSGKTILMREGAYLTIRLCQFSEKEAEEYLEQFKEGYLNTAGVLDYADPLTRKFIADDPVEIEVLKFGRKAGEYPKKALVSPDILPQLKGYLMGVPPELIEEMLKEAKLLAGKDANDGKIANQQGG